MTDTMRTATASHRLLVSKERWERLRNLPDIPILRAAASRVDQEVPCWVEDHTITVDETGHNWHLIRARNAQRRVVSLLVQYGRTGDRAYRDAAVQYLREMGEWEYWSWIKWRVNDPHPNAIFDLSYGENSTTLALAYDWLREELTSDERAMIIEIARTRSLIPYLMLNGVPGEECWFYRRPDSNWNTVCNGGAGMLALALGDDCPESARVLELVEEGVRHYFEFLQEDGAWPEGIGYWNYGHRYGYYYLLSHERATERPHPLLDRPGSRNTLRFPLLFSPNGVPTSFGDVNNFSPFAFHYAAAERFGLWELIGELDKRVEGTLQAPQPPNSARPNAAELLLFHPGETPASREECQWPKVSIQKGLEWSYLADRWPNPTLYASVRGGTTNAPHTHQDLMSLWVVAGDEALISNIGPAEYIDTTFSGRRFELYEMCAASKSTLLVNGVGLPQPATVTTTPINGDGWEGVLLDGTDAMDVGRDTKIHAFGRAVLLLNNSALLVIDHVALQHVALAESRFHTYGKVRRHPTSALISGERASLHMDCAANVPAVVQLGLGLPTQTKTAPERVIRWITAGKHREMVLATLLTPNDKGTVKVSASKRTIKASGPDYAVTLRYSDQELGIW